MLFASLTKVSHWETEKADAKSESSIQVRRPALMSFCNVCRACCLVCRNDSFDVLFDAPICEGHRKVCCGNAPCGGCRFFCVAARPENAGKPYISGLPLHGGKTIPSPKIGVWLRSFGEPCANGYERKANLCVIKRQCQKSVVSCALQRCCFALCFRFLHLQRAKWRATVQSRTPISS